MRKLFLLITLALGIALSGSARGQFAPAGPPAPAQLAQQKQAAWNRALGLSGATAGAQANPDDPNAILLPDVTQTVPTTANPQKLSSSLQILLLLSVLSLAPSILLMTTCFTRIVIVMSLLRQALGAAQLPPNQILIGLSLFMTFLVMGPTWSRINKEAIVPYTTPGEGQITQAQAFQKTHEILREFMIAQVVGAHNEDDVILFYSYAHPGAPEPEDWKDVETTALIPGFILSELKIAFLMGFRIYLPFLIIDMVISSVLISIGMQLLPPVMVSLPFKLLLFVLVDGWHLVCGTLMASFNTG